MPKKFTKIGDFKKVTEKSIKKVAKNMSDRKESKKITKI